MKLKVASTALLIASLYSVHAFSGGGQVVGNGGNAVVCRGANGAITHAELLDFYEARTIRGIRIDLGAPSLSVTDKLRLAISRLQRVSPMRASRYLKESLAFLSQAQFLSHAQLTPVDDSFHLSVPDGCAVEQLALQTRPQFPEDKRYHVNQDLWNALDNDSRAGLILHEIIYHEALESYQTDSRAARYFLSYIASGKTASMNQETFIRFLEEIHFRLAEWNGIWLKLFDVKEPVFANQQREFIPRTPTFYSNGQLKQAWVAEGSTLRLFGKTLRLWEHMDNPENPDDDSATLSYFENGGLERINVEYVENHEPVMINGVEIPSLEGLITFYPSQAVKSLWVDLNTPARTRIEKIPVQIGDQLNFFESGRLESARLSDDVRLPIGRDRTLLTFASLMGSDRIILFPDGSIQQATDAGEDFQVQGRWIRLARWKPIRMYQNGLPEVIELGAPARFEMQDGKNREFEARDIVHFTQDGRAIGLLDAQTAVKEGF